MHAPQPSKTVQCVVSVWDTRFGTLQGLTALASQSDANSSSDSLLALTATTGAPACNVYSVLRNSSDASLFALALDRRVLVCPIVTEPLSLASAIGRMTITSAYVEQSEQADADDAAGSDASLLPPIATTVSAPIVRSALTPAQWEAEIDADDAKELDFIARLSTPQQTPTLQSFTTAFNEYCQSREQQLRHQERRPSKRASSNGDADYDYTAEDLEAGSADAMDTSSGAGGLMNDDMDELHPRLALAGGSFFMHRFMSAVLHRIMSETAFFASAPLALMLKSGCVSVTLVPTLLRRLTDMIPAREGFIRPATPNKQASIPPLQALRLLELVLLHVHDLSETALVSLLRFFLEEADESVLLAYAAEKVDRKGLQFAASVKHVIDLFLFLIISAPRNDIYMQQELRSLGHNLVVILLKFLNRWIGRYGKHGEARLHSKTLAPRTPTFAQLLDWVALILDSHFTRVVFAQDTHNLVADLAATIQQHTQLCERMQDMKGHLFQLAAHGRLPKQPSSALYSIELVDF
ncbi:hypothetical protein CAOG_008205 [Capsaspora owczarzaki ATCC 30864]|uniref:Nucleolar protein 11 C-terminal domain-containing protein n=2 Tax=Capsaspora owczarzaki (strain ATCC 30864) TaxID=595528 RepID=A0A0D2W1L4_CAPO3|nr:hypothetical protein CAOG_008205 [Capsaspora owczarzaki ATCC 30864]